MNSWQSILSEHIQQSAKPLVVILGPTASGKTDFSIEVARVIDKLSVTRPEIINADSRQLYRHLDIGTAKITEEEKWFDCAHHKQRIPHYLFDVLDPKEEVTVAGYKEWTERCIDDIHARSNVPVLVGGSMLYISAVTDGYVFSGRGKKVTKPI
ncbi:hypothetical protein COW95_00830, partial [Candidatus Peregrinibacteria bacterium CG22_combo_CG10-13_8_21_14_all_49_11]